MKLKTSIKFSDSNLNFVRKASINEAFANGRGKQKTPSQMMDLIEKYFKLNNDEYKEMIQMGDAK